MHGVWGSATADKRFDAYCSQKTADPLAAVFVDFPKSKCNFLHKNKLDIVRRVQFLTGRRPVMSFSPGAVDTVVLCKSAPMVLRLSSRSTFSTLVVRRQQRCGLWLQSTVAACFSSSFCVRNTLYAADTLSCSRRDATRRCRLHSGLEPLCCSDCGVNGWQMSRTT